VSFGEFGDASLLKDLPLKPGIKSNLQSLSPAITCLKPLRRSFFVPLVSIAAPHKKERASPKTGLRGQKAEPKAVLNGNHDRPCNAENGARNGVIEDADALVAKELVTQIKGAHRSGWSK
jgi:hypothetical protein